MFLCFCEVINGHPSKFLSVTNIAPFLRSSKFSLSAQAAKPDDSVKTQKELLILNCYCNNISPV